MRQIIENQTFDEERALYYSRQTDIVGCTFAGPADGESVLKESRDIALKNCDFSLRYPLWHVAAAATRRGKMKKLERKYMQNYE